MGSLSQDIDSANDLLIKEYHRLQRDDNNNELLRYISIKKGVMDFIPTNDRILQDEFIERFTNDKTTVFQMWINYYVALRRAVDKIEGIDREPKIDSEKTLKFSLELAASDEEPLPF